MTQSPMPPDSPQRSIVVFDLGGVLIEWDPRHLYRKLFLDDVAGMEQFLAEICSPAWNREQDAGRSWEEAIQVLIDRHPTRRDMIAAFHARWPEMLGGPIAGTVEILAELRDVGTHLYALTNWSQDTFALTRTMPEYAFLNWFEGIVVSGEERLAKPDPRLFEVLLERFGLAAHDLVYIDDSQANVATAAGLGMHGLAFTTPAALRSDLARLGLLKEASK